MAFSATKTMLGSVAQIELVGELDAAAAGDFRKLVDEAANEGAKRLVLLMAALEYMASAGLRALVFAKQKMGANTDIYLVGTNESVMETLELTGFHHSVITVAALDPSILQL